MNETRKNLRAKYRSDKRGEEVIHLAALLARIDPEESAWLASQSAIALTSIGKRLASLAVADCNYGLSPRQKKRRENLAAQAEQLAATYGLVANTGGDPRGYVFRLTGAGIPNNGWGEGFGVA